MAVQKLANGWCARRKKDGKTFNGPLRATEVAANSGMFLLSVCFGMLAFLACLSTFFFRPAAFHTQLRPGAGLACGRFDRQGPTALEQRCATQT